MLMFRVKGHCKYYYHLSAKTKKGRVFEDKFKIKNIRCKPTLLVGPLLASNNINFALNRAQSGV